jgi:hypothetical protein
MGDPPTYPTYLPIHIGLAMAMAWQHGRHGHGLPYRQPGHPGSLGRVTQSGMGRGSVGCREPGRAAALKKECLAPCSGPAAPTPQSLPLRLGLLSGPGPAPLGLAGGAMGAGRQVAGERARAGGLPTVGAGRWGRRSEYGRPRGAARMPGLAGQPRVE